MRPALQVLLLVSLAPNAFAKAPPSLPSAPSRTLITVVTAAWPATTGELRRWERDGKSWRQVGAPIAVVVGRSGLRAAADKREGDGASPAGRFALGEATGYDAAPAGTRLPYRIATAALRCVDDKKSVAYNTLAEAPVSGAPWASDEKMRRDDELYRYTIFVRHNDARTPGMGSCIFLHVWRDARSTTVGCTAMALDDLRALLAWVEPSTLLVQLPRADYDTRQRAWGLPPLPQRK
jgi:zinc D-Ala-D-Ala dipeptidase